MPADLVFGSRNFRREMIGFDVPGDIYAHVGGVDLDPRRRRPLPRARGQPAHPVGRVLRAREPRGAEAHLRRPVRPVRRPRRSTSTRASCSRRSDRSRRDRPAASRASSCSRPGVYNSAYFEHSFLARQMGVELVEARDLVVHGNRVFMRTTQRHAARRRDLPAHRRRLPRPARLPARQPARRARPAQRLPRRQRGARQRDRHRRRRRQGDLRLRAGDDPLLPRRGGRSSATCRPSSRPIPTTSRTCSTTSRSWW